MSRLEVVGYGRDKDSNDKPIGITGAENNELIVLSIEDILLLQKILKELKKFNQNLELITDTKI